MKVFLKYEDNEDEATHKTLKITLPKSWKSGPTSRLLDQFVESYNGGKEGHANTLDSGSLHLSTRLSEDNGEGGAVMREIPSDGVVLSLIPDREDVYICHGPSRTSAEIEAERLAEMEKKKLESAYMSKCVRFGCNQKFRKGGPYPRCKYHSGPPVFHETAKFWSCCPNKKAYDWEGFQLLPTCQTADHCTDVRDEGTNQKEFLGGCDLREQMSGPKLKSIDDFNATRAAGGSEGAPVLERLRGVFEELGVENELFDQVLDGIKEGVATKIGCDAANPAVIDESVKVLGGKLKGAMKAIAVERLRIN